MLSTAADLASLAQAAPWLAVGVLALVASAWVYRQGRRAQKATEERCQLSALRQGKRLGELEKAVGLLDLRRRITEDELYDEGVRLSFWPPDGEQQRRPTPPRPDGDRDEEEAPTAARPMIPPLPDMSRHAR